MVFFFQCGRRKASFVPHVVFKSLQPCALYISKTLRPIAGIERKVLSVIKTCEYLVDTASWIKLVPSLDGILDCQVVANVSQPPSFLSHSLVTARHASTDKVAPGNPPPYFHEHNCWQSDRHAGDDAHFLRADKFCLTILQQEADDGIRG